MSKLLSYKVWYTIGFVIALPIAFVYHLIKIVIQRLTGKTNQSEEYDNAWEVVLLDQENTPSGIEALRSAIYTHFESDDEGRLFVVDYSSGNPKWKQVGMDE